jgi:UDP-N-acetylmuramoyl-tripeptide--D-alanyl-D-alanine ligase
MFQLEHYDKKRFLYEMFILKKWFFQNKCERGKIIFTLRIKLLLLLSFLLLILTSLLISFFISTLFLILFLLVYIILYPFFIVISDIILFPLVVLQKNRIFNNAKNVLNSNEFTSIAITGSYGKTSLKNILHSILEQENKVFMIPGNINTDIGVAKYIINNKDILKTAKFLLVEMGAYKKGEISNTCKIISPDYSFITAIAPVHLDRFGSIENIIDAKFELLENTKKKCYLNISDKNINNNFEKYSTKANLKLVNTLEYDSLKFLDNFAGIEFIWDNKVFKTSLIAEHIISLCLFSLPLCKALGYKIESMQKGIKNINSIPHRLEVLKNEVTGVTVIDDSYNGNYDGFISGLKTLLRAKNRKLIMTPGIVELGNLSKDIHEKIAQEYMDQNIDFILLIKSEGVSYIVSYFEKKKFYNYKVYETAFKAHDDLKNILKKGDTIIFQNDLSDNYL